MTAQAQKSVLKTAADSLWDQQKAEEGCQDRDEWHVSVICGVVTWLCWLSRSAHLGVHSTDDLILHSCSLSSKGDQKSRILSYESKKMVEAKGHFCAVFVSVSTAQFVSEAFLGRCGEQSTCAVFFRAVESETEAKYTGLFIKGCHSEEREEEKR